MTTEQQAIRSSSHTVKYVLAAVAVLAVINVVLVAVLLSQVQHARSEVSALSQYKESLDIVGAAMMSLQPVLPRATQMLELALANNGSWVRRAFMVEFFLNTVGARMQTNIPDVINRVLRTDWSTLAFQGHDMADYAANRFAKLVQQDPDDKLCSAEAYNCSLVTSSVLRQMVLLRPITDPATAPPPADQTDDEVLNFLNNIQPYTSAQLDISSWKKLAGSCTELVNEAMAIDWAGTWGDGNSWNYTEKVQDVLKVVGAYCSVLQ
jgi:hypothetical protein